ncbi:hypothetical protein HYV11_01315 [Candidatus Dependentiae bacterium]|nr:hypothetical protein [Candidatus Dependentiae bacterium]
MFKKIIFAGLIFIASVTQITNGKADVCEKLQRIEYKALSSLGDSLDASFESQGLLLDQSLNSLINKLFLFGSKHNLDDLPSSFPLGSIKIEGGNIFSLDTNSLNKWIDVLEKDLSVKMQQDQDLTVFSKEFIEMSIRSCRKIVQALPQHFTDSYIAELLIPHIESLDSNQIAIDHLLWSYTYLNNQFIKNGGQLFFDDLAYVFKQFGLRVQLPALGQEIFNDFINVLCEGLKQLPYQDQKDLLFSIEKLCGTSKNDFLFKLLENTAKMRRDIVKTNGADTGKLVGYEKMFNSLIIQINKKINNDMKKQENMNSMNVVKLIKITERLLFLN